MLVACRQFKTDDNSVIKDTANIEKLSSFTKKESPTYSMDDIYQTYINPQLQDYLKKKHPTWSVPDRSKWYPQLFNKYKTDRSLVNYISEDFDCNGKKDYALLLDKGGGVLAVVAFLSTGTSFTTVELTENINYGGHAAEKIEFALTLYKPGKYNTSDPDIAIEARHINLKCYAIGIGLFEELFEGYNDVFYWDKKELKSCLIKQ